MMMNFKKNQNNAVRHDCRTARMVHRSQIRWMILV